MRKVFITQECITDPNEKALINGDPDDRNGLCVCVNNKKQLQNHIKNCYKCILLRHKFVFTELCDQLNERGKFNG